MADKDNNSFFDDHLFSDGKSDQGEPDENLERIRCNETTHTANVDSLCFHEDNETNKNRLPRNADLGIDASEDNDVDDKNKESCKSHEDGKRSLSLQLLLQEIYSIADQGGYDTSSQNVMCEVKALNALEATAGDISLSAQFYWDDFLASQENRQNENIHLHRSHRESRGHHHHPPEHWLRLGHRPNDNNDLPIEGMAEGSVKDREVWRVDLPPHFDGDSSNAAAETILRRRLEQSFNENVDNSKLSGNRSDEETEPNKKSGKNRRKRHHPRGNSLETKRMHRNRHHQSSTKRRESSSGMENANSSSSSSSSGMWSDDNEEADNAEHNFLVADNNNYQDRRLRHLEDHNRRQDIENNPLLPRDAVVAAFDNLNGDGDDVDIHREIAAAAESVSVSDDEAAMAGLRQIFVEAKNFKTRKPRILRKPIQSGGDDNDVDRVTASFLEKEQRYWKAQSKDENSPVDVDTDEFDEGYRFSSIKQASIRSNGIVVGDEDEDGYLSDNDWIWDSQTSRDILAPCPPIDILWGGMKRHSFHNEQLVLRGAQEGAEYAPDDRSQGIPASTSGRNKKKTKSRKYNDVLVKNPFGWVAGEKTDVVTSRSDQHNVDLLSKQMKKESKTLVHSAKSSHIDDDAFIRIPYTWLNSGFQFCENRASTAYGLVLHPPNKDDIGYDEWKASSLWRGNARNAVPPPYHCRSLTALISIVNGLLYTGVCIPVKGKLSTENVSSTSFDGSIRQPLIEISEELDELEKTQRMKQHQRQKVKNRGRRDKLKDEENDKLLREQKMPSKQELNNRLTDALSSLLSIAIRASNERKTKALKAFYSKTGKKDFINQQQKLKLERKLQKFPACWFEAENIKRYREHNQTALINNNVEAPGSRNNDNENQVQICVSYTNIEDVRSYVLGNLKAFKSSGGCALFLETVLRIHGKGAVTRMIQKSREKRAKNRDSGSIDLRQEMLEQVHSLKPDASPHLIYCTCEQRHKTYLEQNPLLNRQRSSSGNTQDCDTTPETHDCISIEMISLLLTGYVQSKLEGWSCQLLQLGLLSDVPGQVGKGLTRPEKPVWIVRGPTCYSCLWLNGCNDWAASFSRFDNQIGSVAVLTHWNCWYNVRNQTKLRLVSNRSKPNDWCFPSVSTNGQNLFNNSGNGVSVKENYVQRQSNGNRNALSDVLDLLVESRFANYQRSKEIAETEEIDPRLVVSKEEIDSVIVHREDPKFYAGNYRLWRFKILNSNNKNPDLILMKGGDNGDYTNKASGTDVGIHEQRGGNVDHHLQVTGSSLANYHKDDRWKPYHRLSEREQLIVEMKFGQKLNCILWTRWPRATIDRYEPEGPPAIV